MKQNYTHLVAFPQQVLGRQVEKLPPVETLVSVLIRHDELQLGDRVLHLGQAATLIAPPQGRVLATARLLKLLPRDQIVFKFQYNNNKKKIIK
jgi:hypothetical protein